MMMINRWKAGCPLPSSLLPNDACRWLVIIGTVIIIVVIVIAFVIIAILNVSFCFSSNEDCSHLPMSVCEPTGEVDNLVRSTCQVFMPSHHCNHHHHTHVLMLPVHGRLHPNPIAAEQFKSRLLWSIGCNSNCRRPVQLQVLGWWWWWLPSTFPPWWGNVSDDKGGKLSLPSSHHTW